MRITRQRSVGRGRTGNPTWVLQLGLLGTMFGLGLLSQQSGWLPVVTGWLTALYRDPGMAAGALVHQGAVPQLSLDLRLKDYQLLQAAGEAARQAGGVVSGSPQVPATVHLADTESTALVALLPGPLAENAKSWPLQITLPELTSLNGQRLMTLVPAEARTLLNWSYLAVLRQEGLLANRYQPVQLSVNGRPWGLYALEEFFFPTAVYPCVLYFATDAAWQSPLALWADSARYAQGVVVSDETPACQTAAGLLRALSAGERAPSEVLEVESLAALMAWTTVWQGMPAPDWRTFYLAYRPDSGRLVPIGSAQRWEPKASLPAFLIDDPLVQPAYVRALAALSAPATLAEWQARLGPDLASLYQAVGLELRFPPLPWRELEANQATVRRWLTGEPQLVACARSDGETLVLSLGNVQGVPLELLGLDVGQTRLVPLDSTWVEGERVAVWVTETNTLVLRPAMGSTARTLRLRIPTASLVGTGMPDVLAVKARLYGWNGTAGTVPVQEETAWTCLLP